MKTQRDTVGEGQGRMGRGRSHAAVGRGSLSIAGGAWQPLAARRKAQPPSQISPHSVLKEPTLWTP